MAYTYQEEAEDGRGAELAVWFRDIYVCIIIIINIVCNTETLIHLFI
jgi:hypothetical protein